MKKQRAFLLLEVSCFGFLFLCSILPYIVFQKNVFVFVQKDKKKLEGKIRLQNARILLERTLETKPMEGKLYYGLQEGWTKDGTSSIYESRIQKTLLSEAEKAESIWYFQIYDINTKFLIWEGWKLERE